MDALAGAAQIIRQRGWWRGPLIGRQDPDCECIAGAVSEADPPHANENLAALKRRLGLPPDQGSLATWNDDPSRTIRDVLEALENAS